MRRFMLLLITLVLSTGLWAQSDSTLLHDSLVKDLEHQLQEVKLQAILLQEQLSKYGESHRQDSLRKVRSQQRIDSLRQFTKGYPVVIDKDTLFVLYAQRGGVTPRMRAQEAMEAINILGHSLKLEPDSIYTIETEYTTDIMGDELVILTLYNTDGMWNNTSREELASQYVQIISQKVQEMHYQYGLKKKLMGVIWMLVVILVQFLLYKLTVKLFSWIRRQIASNWVKKLKPLKMKDYELLNVHQQGRFLLSATRIGQFITILLQLSISILLLFYIFPETKAITYRLIGYVWNPMWGLMVSVVRYIPKLIQLFIIYYIFRCIVRLLRYMSGEIASGKLKIKGFYPEWSQPTFLVLRLMCYAFMFVIMWPLLPYSDSNIFKGISVFLGVIVSFSSSSVISNMVSGIVMTYMRPFRIGDFIRFEDDEGEVIEKNALATHIRTLKNDIITIPNSSILSAKTFNYTLSAENYGIIVHTQFTMGYDINWRTCERLLIEAALATPHIESHPKPFVLAHALDDSYLTYEINAYTRYSQDLLTIYSELHKNVVDKFNEAGIEVMAPHIYARRDGIRRQSPDYDDKR